MPFIVSFRFHTWAVVVVCRHVVSIRGWSFSNVGSRFCTWAVVAWWWWWWSAVAGLSISLPHCCQQHGPSMSLVRGWCWALVAVGAVRGWCVVVLPLLWHGRRLLWLWLW